MARANSASTAPSLAAWDAAAWMCCGAMTSDDDDWGCGFGDYDEGPGNMACMMTSLLMCLVTAGCFGGSVAAIAVGANPNSTYIGP